MWNQQIFGLCSVNRIAKPPTADGLVAFAMAALCRLTGKTGPALAERRDSPHQNSIADFVPKDAGSDFVNHTHRFMSNNQSRSNRILTLDDMQIGTADCC